LSIGKLSAGQIGNLVVNVGGGISGITAASWADGSLTASWLASLSIAGNCGADVTLNSNQAGTLGKGSIAGTLQDAVWNIWGPVSSLAVGRWGAGSRLAVRVYPGGDGTYFTGDDSTSPPLGSIAKLTIAAFETAHDHDFGILAAAYTSIKLGTIVPVLPFANNQFRIVRVV
jgi:hypothetical protein